MVIRVFNPEGMQNVNFKYAPKAISIQIGNSSGTFHYTSKVFDVDQDSTSD